MLSFVSSQKIRITSWLSTPTALHTPPISLAKVTFTAWNELHAYLTVSATPMAAMCTGASMPLYSARTSSALLESCAPMSVNGGA